MKITLATLQTAESEAPKIPDEASLPEDQELADQCPVNTLEQIEQFRVRLTARRTTAKSDGEGQASQQDQGQQTKVIYC